MIENTYKIVALATLGLAAAAAVAQDKEAEPAFVYATYFECDVSEQATADRIVEESFAPIYDDARAAGYFDAWSWVAHHTGGHWRRANFMVAPTLEALFEASDAVGDVLQAEAGEASAQFGAICGRHEDYIWRFSNTDQPTRGDASFSSYWACDMSRADRLDALFDKTLKPILERQAADGQIMSWSWLSHVIGGEWQRVLNLTGKDTMSLIRARGAAIAELSDKNRRALDEFSSICSRHQDYLWDAVVGSP